MNPPRRNSKKYKEILEKGCGGYFCDTINGFEYDCTHGYEWECDYCPIVIEKHFKGDKKCENNPIPLHPKM